MKNIYRVCVGDMITYRVRGCDAYGQVTKVYLNAVGVRDYDGAYFIVDMKDVLEIGTVLSEDLEDEFYPMDMQLADLLSSVMPLEYWCLLPIVASIIIAVIHYI